MMSFDHNPQSIPPAPEWRVDASGDFFPEEGTAALLPFSGEFDWGGWHWEVLGIYSCPQGLVVDLARQIPEQTVRDYLAKWHLTWESDTSQLEKSLSPLELMELEGENPFQWEYGLNALVDGQELEGDSGSGELFLPWPDIAPTSYSSHWVVDHYSLDKTQCWALHRQVFPWTQREISTLRLKLWGVFREIPGKPFQVEPGETVRLENPVTGESFTLTALTQEEERLPQEEEFPSFPQMGRWAMPSYGKSLVYTLEPEPQEPGLYLKDMAPMDEPQCLSGEKKRYPGAVGFLAEASQDPAAYGVEGKVHAACSAPHFAPVDRVTWFPVFREKTAGETIVPLTKAE